MASQPERLYVGARAGSGDGVERRPVQRVGHCLDHAPRGVPQQLGVAVERYDETDVSQKIGVAHMNVT